MPFRLKRNSPDNLQADSIRINKNTQAIHGSFRAIKFRDKDTRQIVIYIPSLQLTSYGADDEKAEEMMTFSMEDFFEFIINLAPKKLAIELEGLGWKHNHLKNKEFSKMYVDISGELKNFNAVADTVEQLTLVA